MSSMIDRRHELLGEILEEMARLITAAEQVRAAAGTNNRTLPRPSVAGSVPWAIDRVTAQGDPREHRELIEDIARASTFAAAADQAYFDLLTSVAGTLNFDAFGRGVLAVAHIVTNLDKLREHRESLAGEVHAMQELYTRIVDVTGD